MSGTDTRSRSAAAPYGWACVVLAGGLLARAALDSLIRDRSPFSPLYLSVLISARYLGLGPSLFVLGGAGIAAMWMSDWSGWERVVPFVVTSLVMIWFL